MQSEQPAGIFHFQKVIAIPQKSGQKVAVEHLSSEAIELLLKQPNAQSARGRRDLTLLSVLYDTGARVQELIDLRPCDVLLEGAAVITLTGKGNKVRRVPVLRDTANLLNRYLIEHGLEKAVEEPVSALLKQPAWQADKRRGRLYSQQTCHRGKEDFLGHP